MSMLAEPRRKQRISVDPQNKSWSKDSSAVAHRLMARMGWSDGKGLGAREDGMTTHIKVQMRSDARGVGAERTSSDNWLDNSVAFDALLKNLNSDSPAASTPGSPRDTPDPSEPSAAPKTGTRRNNLYRKFLRAKDMSTYASENVNEILASSKRERRAADIENDLQEKKMRAKRATVEEDESDDGEARPSFTRLQGSPTSSPIKDEDEDEHDERLSKVMHLETQTVSINDYFTLKARERAALQQAAEEPKAANESEDSDEEAARLAKRARKEARREARRQREAEAAAAAAKEQEEEEETKPRKKSKKRRDDSS